MNPDLLDRNAVALVLMAGLMGHHNPGVAHEPTKLAAAARYAFTAADAFLAEAKAQADAKGPQP